MYKRFRERFGTAGVIIAVIALIAALGGTAIAAGGLTTKQKKEVTKIAKKYAGKPGPAGPQGPQGNPGSAGTPGKTGKEGPEGKQGKEGSPWTAGGTLPSGVTLRGTWSVGGVENQFLQIPISFNIPLNGPLTAANVHFASNATGTGKLTNASKLVENLTPTNPGEVFANGDQISGAGIPAGATIAAVVSSTELELSAAATASGPSVALTAEPPAACPGSVANPQAEPGNLCLFYRTAEGVLLGGPPTFVPRIWAAAGAPGASPFGARVTFVAIANPALVDGSWAVKAD